MLTNYRRQAHTGPACNKQNMTTIVCIAGGPSLLRADVALCERAGLVLMGINNAYQITDKLTYHYACDTKWWREHYPYTQAHTRKFSLKSKKKDEGHSGVEQMQRGQRDVVSHKWPILGTGGNSGFQALNLAYLLGYKTIILLGYDMQEQDGQTHWHPDHDFKGATNPAQSTFRTWIKTYNKIAPELASVGVHVLNATRRTALDAFPCVKLEDVL